MSKYEIVSPTTNITYKVKLVHGNYRVYKNGTEIWKSEGKTKDDFEAAKHWLNATLDNDNKKAQQKVEPETEAEKQTEEYGGPRRQDQNSQKLS